MRLFKKCAKKSRLFSHKDEKNKKVFLWFIVFLIFLIKINTTLCEFTAY